MSEEINQETTEQSENTLANPEMVEDTPTEPTEEQPKEEVPNDLELLKQEVEKLKKQNQEAQSFIGRQTTEIGQLRKMVETTKEKPVQKKLDLDTFVSDPEAAIKAELQKREEEAQEKYQKEIQTIQQNVATVLQNVPDYEQLVDTIIEIAKEDGMTNVDKEVVFNTARHDPSIAIQYAKRAQMKLKYEGKVSSTKKALDNAQKFTKNPTAPKTASVAQGTKRAYTQKEIKNLSTAELKKYLEEINK